MEKYRSAKQNLPMIKNVVFDIGGVLVDFDPIRYLSSIGYQKAKAKQLAEAIYFNKTWHDLDTGIYDSFACALPTYLFRFDSLKKDIKAIAEKGVMHVYDVALPGIELLLSLKKMGYHVYLLTNLSKEAFAYVKQKHPALKEVDGYILSADVHLVKPDPRIFAALLDKYHLVAEETLFLDDSSANVRSANSLHINAIQYATKEKAIEKLKAFGIEL